MQEDHEFKGQPGQVKPYLKKMKMYLADYEVCSPNYYVYNIPHAPKTQGASKLKVQEVCCKIVTSNYDRKATTWKSSTWLP